MIAEAKAAYDAARHAADAAYALQTMANAVADAAADAVRVANIAYNAAHAEFAAKVRILE